MRACITLSHCISHLEAARTKIRSKDADESLGSYPPFKFPESNIKIAQPSQYLPKRGDAIENKFDHKNC